MKAVEIDKTGNEAILSVVMENDSVWLNQQQLSTLFSRDRSVISKYLSAIFKDGELSQDGTCAFFAHMGENDQNYQVLHYNLDVIISVGYQTTD